MKQLNTTTSSANSNWKKIYVPPLFNCQSAQNQPHHGKKPRTSTSEASKSQCKIASYHSLQSDLAPQFSDRDICMQKFDKTERNQVWISALYPQDVTKAWEYFQRVVELILPRMRPRYQHQVWFFFSQRDCREELAVPTITDQQDALAGLRFRKPLRVFSRSPGLRFRFSVAASMPVRERCTSLVFTYSILRVLQLTEDLFMFDGCVCRYSRLLAP